MRLSTSGIVTNQYNDVLLILRDDSRTWAPPGGGIEANELPPEAAAREVEEETGVKVLPVRLVALQYMREGPDGELTLIFRCLIRGGEPTPSAESLQVGFHRSQELPKPMFSMHKQMLRAAIQHSGGPPAWHETRWPWGVRLARDLIYGYRNMRRRLLRRPSSVPPPTWRVAAFTMIVNPAGQILWAKRRDRDLWHTAWGRCAKNAKPPGKPPYEKRMKKPAYTYACST